MRGVKQADDRGDVIRRCRSGIADGGVVGIEEFPNGVDVVRDVEGLDAEVLVLKGGPDGRGASGAGDADAVIIAEFDGAEEALGEGLAGRALGAVLRPPGCDVLADSELIPARGIDRGHACAIIS